MDSNTSNVHEMGVRIKVVTAAIGAGVIVTMGALTMAFSGNETHAVTAQVGGAGDTSTPGAATIDTADADGRAEPYRAALGARHMAVASVRRLCGSWGLSANP